MNLPPALIVQILSLLVAVLLWASAGRHLTQHTHPAESTTSFAPSLLAGMGLWVAVWWLIVPLGGGHTLAAAGVFMLITFALAAGTLRQWARWKKNEEHFLSLFVIHLLLLAVWVMPLLANQPAGEGDLWNLHAANLLHHWGRWPLADELAALPALPVAPAWLPVSLAPALPAANVTLPLLMTLNVLMLLAAANLLATLANIPIRWSNLLWVGACSLLGMVLLAPLWSPAHLSTTVSTLAAPVALLAAMAPLFRPQPAMGMAALPAALSLALLATVHPWGAPVSVGVGALWLLRGSMLYGPVPAVLLAASLMVCLPWLLLMAVAASGYPPALHGCFAAPLWPDLPRCLVSAWPLPPLYEWQTPLLIGLAGVAAFVTLMQVELARRLLWMPWLLVLLVLGISLLQADAWPHALQLVMLLLTIPLVFGAVDLYRGSIIKRMAYLHPWSMGGLLAVPLLAAILALSPLLRHFTPPVINHAHEVAADLAAFNLKPAGRPLVAIGVPPLAVAALNYKLGLAAHPLWVWPESSSMAVLYRQMHQHKVPLAWLGPAVAAQVVHSPEPLPASLLVEAGENSMLVRAVYPLHLPMAKGEEFR